MNPEKLEKASRQESEIFEKFYLWLEKSMPETFFKDLKEEEILLIVRGLISFKVQDYFVEIHLRNAAFTLCFDTPGADVNILKSYPMYGIKNYTTYVSKEPLPFPDNPGLLRIAVIEFTSFTEESVSQTIESKFLEKLTEDKKISAYKLFEQASQQDECQYQIVKEEGNPPSCHVLMAWKNVPKHNFMYRLARVIYQHDLVMKDVNSTIVNPQGTNSVLMLSFNLYGNQGKPAWESCDLQDFLEEISMLKYFGSQDLIDETFVVPKLLSGNLANFLRSLMNFIHQVLVHADPNLYTLENILEGLTRHPELTLKLTSAFEAKFHPQKVNLHRFSELRGEFILLVKQLDTGQELLDLRRKNILLQGMNFVEHLLKTNFYQSNKSALIFRLDPKLFDVVPYEREKIFPELPYALFFFKGMHYIGFHVRFRDLARGGLRTITPSQKERVLAERNSVFLECYHLAYTQQKKNKDIPEGGAKGVIFLKPDERYNEEIAILRHELSESNLEEKEIEKKVIKAQEEHKLEYLYQTQRTYVKALLSLINCESDGQLKSPNTIDYWKRPEYIYLGPDENMHNVMIDWIADESKRVGYKPGGAFISGKSKTGINHKEYGVTSLGVNVFMHEALLSLGIDPFKEVFTVKMTGGPDGDVAGNEICNLHQYYPQTAKLVALTDVSGTIYDPNGLNLESCINLFRQAHSISKYPPQELSEGGFLLDLSLKKELSPYVFQTLCIKRQGGVLVEEWLDGNDMNALYRFNVHKTKATIFLPCGGRPRTLRDTNVEEFLDENGRSTSQAIVEGANLYFSPWARTFLEEKGVLIFKDSSANKCGVISSSFEILAGLTLTDEEFAQNKPALVRDILERLKKVSRDEARLLLETHEKTKEPLTELSEKISERINFYTDQLLAYLEEQKLSGDPKDPLIRCFLGYCLKVLREKFHDRLLKEVPEVHKKAIIASHIASRMIYKRGLEWSPSLVEVLPLILKEEELFD